MLTLVDNDSQIANFKIQSSKIVLSSFCNEEWKKVKDTHFQGAITSNDTESPWIIFNIIIIVWINMIQVIIKKNE